MNYFDNLSIEDLKKRLDILCKEAGYYRQKIIQCANVFGETANIIDNKKYTKKQQQEMRDNAIYYDRLSEEYKLKADSLIKEIKNINKIIKNK